MNHTPAKRGWWYRGQHHQNGFRQTVDELQEQCRYDWSPFNVFGEVAVERLKCEGFTFLGAMREDAIA